MESGYVEGDGECGGCGGCATMRDDDHEKWRMRDGVRDVKAMEVDRKFKWTVDSGQRASVSNGQRETRPVSNEKPDTSRGLVPRTRAGYRKGEV
jgi:hypothetical protein